MANIRSRRGRKPRKTLEILNPNAAGIDVGSGSHFVAVPSDCEGQTVREFECFTADLHRLAQWLKSCDVDTVVMESTGVYWIPLFQILEAADFTVLLVDARRVKNVPGRKSDVQDCQWLQQLHSYGLLSGAFRPDDQICVLRSYTRQRANLVRSSSPHILRMQKALTQMNVQLHKVISDITGVTGLRIIDAILAGERDPNTLAKLKHGRNRTPLDRIANALEGDYRDEQIFILKQELETYRYYSKQISDCEVAITAYIKSFEERASVETLAPPTVKGKGRRNPALRTELFRISGVDFTEIPGLDALTVQTIISEIGLDATRWPTAKHFASWLGLSPTNRITGGKIQSSSTRKVVNRATQAFRMAAQSLSRSPSAMGAYYRRMRAKLGGPSAVTAAAHKLARTFYRMLKSGQPYEDQGAHYYDEQHRERVIKSITKRARLLGLEIVPKQPVTEFVS